MSEKPILTETELKQYITRILMTFRQDLEREMAACGTLMETIHDFYALLSELTDRFELDTNQRALVCGLPAGLFHNPPDVPLVIICPNGHSIQGQRLLQARGG